MIETGKLAFELYSYRFNVGYVVVIHDVKGCLQTIQFNDLDGALNIIDQLKDEL